MEKEPRPKLPDKYGSEDEEKLKKEMETESKIENGMYPYVHAILEKKIKERGVPEDIIKKIMAEQEQMGLENKGEKLHKESINIFKQELIDEMVDRYMPRKLKHLGIGDDIKEFHLRKHLTDQEVEALKNIELTDEEYQEMIDKIFESK